MPELAGAETASRGGQLERPQEVGGLLEVGTDGEDLVNQVFNRDDTVFPEVRLDEGVVGLR